MGHAGGGFNPLDIDAIRRDNRLPELVGATAKLSRAGAAFKCLCPLHQERTPSFYIFDGGARWHCFGCGSRGDVLDYVQALHGVGLRDAAAMLQSGDLPKVQTAPLPAAETRTETQERARQIWCNAVSARGTLAARYLASRSITIPLPDDIRFARLPYGKQGQEFNAMVALLRDAGGNSTHFP
ncbi:hypothetical protein A8B75_14990 [Sphingomonadales bacterium EhC05]|nr:hypothetical protein A8B75_14990 [Sphingomonadales bacterium EhC05]